MDGLGIHVLANEWHSWFAGARIDKVHQPSARELVLTLRTGGKNERILLSAHRQMARAHVLRHIRPNNPQDPPMFCMLLRRRIEGGRIISVWQPGWERILGLEIEAQNDFGDLVKYHLILEVMGKHSNLVFCQADEAGNPSKIVDSIVHVTPDMSRVRPVLPGHLYTAPPPQDKLSIEDLKAQMLVDTLANAQTRKQVERNVTSQLQGAGPETVREALFRAHDGQAADTGVKGPAATDAWTITAEEVPRLAEQLLLSLRQIYDEAVNRKEPATVAEDQLGQTIAAAPFRMLSQTRVVNMDSYDEALEKLYQSALTMSQFSAEQRNITRSVTESLDKLRGKLVKLENERFESLDSETPRIYGEVLMAFAYQVEKGASSVTLPNFYDDDNPLEIQLNPALSATQNATHYFKTASKKKRAIPLIAEEIAQTTEDINYLESVLALLEQTEPRGYGPIRTELERQGFLNRKREARNQGRQSRAKAKAHDDIGKPEEYLSLDGFRIRVGRNNLQNDRLTLKWSQPDDVWLHVKDAPGSHVVIQTERRTIPEATLHQAALLAAYFSKLRTSVNVPVDYTETRHVWKPNGARPGHVLYDHQKTLYATPDKSLIDAIARP